MSGSLRIVVAVCTRNRLEPLGRCLSRLERLRPAPDEIVVSDQSDEPVAASVRSLCGRAYRYLRVPEKGLGLSRQRVLESVSSGLIAFTDDDCLVAPGWVGAIVDAFATHADVAAVTGAVRPDPDFPLPPGLPAWVTQWGGDEERLFVGPVDPTEIGGGLNMSFRVEALRAIGGFDPLLGPGGVLLNADDADTLHRVLLAGMKILYVPRAIVSHFPPRDEGGHRSHEYLYARGLGAWAARRRRLGDRVPTVYLRRSLFLTLELLARGALHEGPRKKLHRLAVAWNLLAGWRLGWRLGAGPGPAMPPRG